MKVCLINPPIVISIAHANRPTPFYPMGLLSVAAMLEREHQVSILDTPTEGWRDLRRIQVNGGPRHYLGLDFEQIAKRIERDRPDVVGITVPFSIGHWSAQQVASAVKEVDRGIVTILGGHHPSIRPTDVLASPNVDFAVVGEGEYTMLELLRKLDQGKSSELEQVPGIGYRLDGKVSITATRPLIQDLDVLPFPARHLLPMDEYFAASRDNKMYRGSYVPQGACWATVITSRGCPFQCVFCAIHLTMGRKWRGRSPENVIQEIEHLVSTYAVNYLTIEDDNMTLDRERAKRICDLIIERGFDIHWSMPNGVRADTLDEELVGKMKQSGCTQVFVSPESGDQRVVNEIIKKRMDLRRVEEAVSLFKKHGIIVNADFVIGLIGETKENIRQSLNFARKLLRLGASGVHATIAIPYYETELFKEAMEKGYLRAAIDDQHLNSTEPLIETPEFTAEELLHLRDQFLMANSWLILLRLAISNPKLAMRRLFSFKSWWSLIKSLGGRLLPKGSTG